MWVLLRLLRGMLSREEDDLLHLQLFRLRVEGHWAVLLLPERLRNDALVRIPVLRCTCLPLPLLPLLQVRWVLRRQLCENPHEAPRL